MTPDAARDKVLSRPRFTADEVGARTQDPVMAARGLFAWYAPGFSDRLGDRLRLFDNTEGPPLELLRLRADFSRAPDFEFCLRARVGELRDFEHPNFARVCRADRLPEPGGGLALVSVRADGVRLAEIMALARQRGARLAADLALPLVGQLAGAIAALHGRGRHIVHGTISADRLVIGPGGRLLVTEYVLGSALRGLALSPDQFWRELGVALPAGPATPFEQSTDVLQIGLVALSLLGSEISCVAWERLPELLQDAEQRAVGAGWDSRWPVFRSWLERALQPAPHGFANAGEASLALAGLVPRQPSSEGDPRAWDRFVTDCDAAPELKSPASGWNPALGDGSERVIAADSTPISARLDTWEQRSPVVAAGEEPHGSRTPDEPAAQPPPMAQPQAEPDSERRDWRAFKRPVARRGWHPWLVVMLGLVALLALGEGIYIAAGILQGGGKSAGGTGSVQIVSHPTGALVLVDGIASGRTPVTLELRAGSHNLELTSGTRRRTVPVTIAAGALLSQVVELPGEVPATGDLRITTQPAGLRVTVDGEARGASPLLVAGLAPGPHAVRVDGQGRSLTQTVDVTVGRTASLVMPIPGAGAPAPGWLSIPGDVELNVFEDGELLGTSRSPRIMLAAGRHELDLVNDELGLRMSEEVHVPVGRTATLEVNLPSGRVDLNALPWAEVWIDGERVGETPLGNVRVPVGRHSVTFRHPQLGERKVECVVALRRPTRVAVDLRK